MTAGAATSSMPRRAFALARSDWLVAAYVVAYVVSIVMISSGVSPLRPITNVAYFGIGIVTVVAQWRLATACDLDHGTRRAWRWLSVSSACIIVAGAVWTLWAVVHPADTNPDWSNWASVAYAPCAVIGYLSFPRRRDVRSDWRRLLDIILLAVGGFALSWWSSLQPLLAGSTPIAANVVASVLSEWIVVVAAAIALFSARNAAVRGAVGLLLAAEVTFIFGDYVLAQGAGVYHAGDPVDAIWFLAWVARWGGARYAAHARLEQTSAGNSSDAEYRSGIAATAFVAATYLTLAFAVLGSDTHASQAAMLAALMTVLLLARQQVEFTTNRRLARVAAGQAHRFRALLERASDYIVVLDDDYRVSWTSPSLGGGVAMVTRRPFKELVHPDDAGAVERWLRRADERQGTLPLECRLHDNGTAWIDVALRVADHRTDPTVRGLVVNARNISAEVALEGRLRHTEKLATLNEMAGRIAHAFNNTLAMIAGHAELLADQLGDLPQQRDDVAAIRAAADRGAGIIRQLVGFSGRHVIQPVRLQVADTVEALAPALSRGLPKGVSLNLTLTARSAVVMSDRAQFEQVVVNLVTNARDAMADGGVIDLSVTEGLRRVGEPPEVVLAVRDGGVGIADADLSEIFRPFFTTKAPGRGTGLGLAMVDAIVRRAGGSIAVQSAVGVGTTVSVHLPLAPFDVSEPVPAPEPTAPRGRGVVLLVDDERGVRVVARRMLQRAGFTVLEASGGAEALAIAGRPEQLIEILVTDMMMPGMSGSELITRFSDLRPGTPIVVVTGFAALQEQEASLEARVFAIVGKPFSSSALVQAVAAALGIESEAGGAGSASG